MGVTGSDVDTADPALRVRAVVAWDEPIGAVRTAHFGHNAVWCRGGLGLWDDARAAPVDGVLAAVRALRPGVLRFPGGTRAMRYHFAETIGPRAARIAQCDPFTGRRDATRYGLDEFMHVAAAVGADVTLVSAWVDGTPEEAAALVAYANGEPSCDVVLGVDENGVDWGNAGDWARRRAANGHPAPYGARWLEIGNEQHLDLPSPALDVCGRPGPFRQNERWVRGERVPTDEARHADGVLRTGRLVRAIDPRIAIGATARARFGAPDDVAADAWNVRLVQDAGEAFDFFVLHPYVLPRLLDADSPQDRIALVDALRRAARALRRLAPTKGIGVTEFGSLFDADTLDNALLTADMVRVAAEEDLVLLLRHLLIEDDPGGPFACGAALLGDGHGAFRRTPGYHAMRSLATSMEAVAVRTDGVAPAGVAVLASRAAGGTRLGLALVDRRTVFSAATVAIPLPPGAWRGEIDVLDGETPLARGDAVTVRTIPFDATGELVLRLDAHPRLTVVRATRRDRST